MKAICEGRKNKREVIQDSLDQYRDVYLRVQQQLPMLHAVSLSLRMSQMTQLTECRPYVNTSLPRTTEKPESFDQKPFATDTRKSTLYGVLYDYRIVGGLNAPEVTSTTPPSEDMEGSQPHTSTLAPQKSGKRNLRLRPTIIGRGAVQQGDGTLAFLDQMFLIFTLTPNY